MRIVLVALLLVAASAQAYGPDPRLYFLKDDANGPVGDGILDINFPPVVDTQPNAENKSAPGVRNVVPFMEQVFPVQFIGGAGNNTGHLFGPVIVALWAPSTPAMQNATLRVELIKVTEPSPLYPLPAGGEVLASSEVQLYWDNESMPPPESLIPGPPTAPNGTDPVDHAMAEANRIAGEVLADALPLALYPPFVLILDDDVPDYFIDEYFEKTLDLGLRITVWPTPGSTVPQGLAQPIEYDFLLAPSFVYAPWFNDTMPEPATPNNPGSGNSNNPPVGNPEPSDPTPTDPKESETGGKDSPGIGVIGLLLVLGFALHRRRQ